ncbi:TonB-dependent receptor [Proteiniphilum sp. UBA5510]|jgi:TonB-linked SusC/RagA family outer membrane protein|uniref:TonB-dependent receptor n=1 Tax=Proteiniphilum sp. UBA5510 TaxID=1947286 RepID=UPI00257DDC15|nr:TonB-dependent receptor [Proteiniphilum sp. UBA5510]
MKKNNPTGNNLTEKVPIKHFLLIMRTTFILLFICVFCSMAEMSYTQNARVTINKRNVTLREVLNEIESQTDYLFIYNDKVNTSEKVSVKANHVSVYTVLSSLLKEKGVKHSMEGNHIILKTIEKESDADKEKLHLAVQQQKKQIVGKVTDLNGEPIIGANVVEIGTTNGTITDIDGNFSLNVEENANIRITYIGYLEQEIRTTGKANFIVSMQEDTQSLDELVVVGYGTQRKVNLTGAISSVNMEKLENRPITNASQALQGVSGLYVNQAGGQPGKDDATLRIRGQGTLNNNNPLVLVDGIEYPLAAVNPHDIESISVLKDAASASIYGNRAANGVVLVTTKKGKEGKTRIEYNNYFGVQEPTYLPKVVTDPVQFMELRDQAQRNAGRATVDYGEAVIEEYRQGMSTDPYVYPNNNWLDIMFNKAMIQEHNLRFSGGRDKINYTLSLGYLDQNGVLMGTNSNKLTLRSNVNFQANDKVKVGTDISVSNRFIHEPATGVPNLMEMVFKAQAFHPTYLEDGRYADTWVRTPGHNVYRHPLVWAKEGYLDTRNFRWMASVHTDIELPFDFSYHAKMGVNKLDQFQSQFVPDIYMYQNKTLTPSRVDYYTDNKNRHVTNRDDEDLNITLFHTLNWIKKINDKHNFSGLIGSSYESFSSRNFSATIEGFLGNDLHEINAGSTNPSVTGTSLRNVLIGAFGRINYDFQQKYLFEANLRYDGSSKFAKGNRWGAFPSFSAGWRLDQENFLKNQDWISGLKLRTSYGSLGNERIGSFRYVNLIDAGQDYYFGNSVFPGVAITRYNDADITWETTSILNIGIDAILFKDKLNLTFELYDKKTKNILRTVNLPAQVGNLGGPIMNIGTVSNKGYELSIAHQNRIQDFIYQIDFGINYNVNKVIDLNGQEIIDSGFSGQKSPTIIKEGYPIDSYFILESDGIFQTQEEIEKSPFQNITTKPGYLKYKNQNNDNVIDADDRKIIGKAIPDYTYNFSLNLSYKNWSLSGFFNGIQGLYTYPSRIIAVPFWFGTSVTQDWVDNSWRPDRTNARLPILTTYEESQGDIYAYSDFWLLDASYLRLKNVQLSYSFPQEIIKKLGINKLFLFFNGQNLFTISKMKNFDPEKNITGDNYYEYPSVKTYSAGLNVTF